MGTAEVGNRGQDPDNYSQFNQKAAILGVGGLLYFGGALAAGVLSTYLVLVAVLAFGAFALFYKNTIDEVPEWVMLNLSAVLLSFYIATSTAEVLPTWALIWLILGLAFIDVPTSQGGRMASYLVTLVKEKIPAFLVFPGSSQFSYQAFQDGIDQESGARLPDCRVLGIGDLVPTTALAISLAISAPAVGPVAPLAIGVASGGLLGLALVVAIDPEIFGALVVIVPASLAGLVVSTIVTGSPLPALLPAATFF